MNKELKAWNLYGQRGKPYETGVPKTSGIARFFDAQGKQTQWPPLSVIMNFKQITIIY
jgi:hypothetical protein